jgi:flagellar basal-body rod modification protein FlgD
MDTSAIQSSTGGLSGALTGNAAASGMGKEDFLKLLVAQLAHQDPLAPMENTEFVAQLAQFSSLEQLMGVNSNLGLLQVAQTAMTNSQVAGLIGREIEARGDTLNHTSGPEAINFDLSSSAKEVTVKVRDAKGNLIRTIDAGSRIGGVNSVTWDGKDSMGNTMPAGTYSVEVTAKRQPRGGVVPVQGGRDRHQLQERDSTARGRQHHRPGGRRAGGPAD